MVNISLQNNKYTQIKKSSQNGFMFDTNIFDQILDNQINIENIKETIFITHIQQDEIEEINNIKRKESLISIFSLVNKELIPTESVILGVSKFGGAKFGSGAILDNIINGNYKNTKDALIAETAIKNNLILVTEDINLSKKVKENGGLVISWQEFFNRNYEN